MVDKLLAQLIKNFKKRLPKLEGQDKIHMEDTIRKLEIRAKLDLKR